MFEDYETFDWVMPILFLVLMGIIVIGIIFYVTMTKCVEYEDLCYKRVPVCGKGCIIVEKPTDCGNDNAVGHKKFCTKKIWRWEK